MAGPSTYNRPYATKPENIKRSTATNRAARRQYRRKNRMILHAPWTKVEKKTGRKDMPLCVSRSAPLFVLIEESDYFVENFMTVVVSYFSPGLTIVEGKSGWLGLSG